MVGRPIDPSQAARRLYASRQFEARMAAIWESDDRGVLGVAGARSQKSRGQAPVGSGSQGVECGNMEQSPVALTPAI
jgi:hypothetical protein